MHAFLKGSSLLPRSSQETGIHVAPPPPETTLCWSLLGPTKTLGSGGNISTVVDNLLLSTKGEYTLKVPL